MRSTPPFLSVVLPVFNEAENLAELYERLSRVLGSLAQPYELLFIDDGSRDATAETIQGFHQQDSHVRLLQFSRNFGHQMAVSAGLAHAQGQAVIVMDSDLQDAPEDIPKLVAAWQEGFAVVYAIRQSRQEGWLLQWAYRTFYALLNRFAEIEIPPDSGDFSLMDRKVVDLINALPERNRFVRGLRAWVGFSQKGIPVHRSERFSGKPKYTLKHLVHLALSGILGFSVIPLRFATLFGVFVSLVSFFSIFIVIALRLFTTISLPGFAATASILLFLGGVQLLTIGILGEYLGKVYQEVKQRPNYIIKQTLG